MRLLLIFALTFTISAQQGNKNNAEEESMESGQEMMRKVMDALSEKHLMEIINALNKKDVEKLTDCMEDECKMADFLDLMEKMIYLFKEISHVDKPICDLIKAIVKHGPLAELVNELSEEHTLEIINALTAKEIGKLMNIGKPPINIFVLTSIGKKIIPILKKANDGKGVSKLISTFTGGGDGNTEKSNDMLGKIMKALSEEHIMKMINTFNAEEVEKLTDCLEDGCNTADSMYLIEKILNVLKGISHGDKQIYNLIKELFKHGPLALLVNELSEEWALEIINALNGKDFDKLMNIGTSQVEKSEIISIGKKIIPILKKAKGGKGVSKLMSIFTDDEDEKTDLPYYHPVHGGLHPGMSVYMQGTVPERSNRTWVNLQVDFACGQHKEADVPLQFRPHINGETVALSTLQAGRWGEEEKHMNPFRTGEQFEVVLIVHGFGYQVLVNRKDLCTYSHRIPAQNVRVIRIDGDLELQTLSVMGGPVILLSKKTLTLCPNGQTSDNTKSQPKNAVLHIGKKNQNTKYKLNKQDLADNLHSVKDLGILISKDKLPYYHPVSDGLHPGMSVYLRGKVLRNCNWFKVDFVCGKSVKVRIPLHFNPRFEGWNIVVLNTYQFDRWGKAVRHQNPFQKGEHFEIIFIVNEAEYQILVNGKPLGKFEHRIPPQFINIIDLGGNLELQSLTMVKRQIVENTLLTGPAIYYPPVPYTGNIPGGLGTNTTITVRGFIPKNATSFSFAINLMASQIIALHLTPRMKPWRSVVRNSFLNGRWGAEEYNVPFNPFQFGQYFEVSICCDKQKFKVYTSGRHLFNYNHRYATIGHIRTLGINGDVTLSYIKY